jgi:transcription initiation factor TFIIIB Brf1 subunit/transcription initiation factor TFIIB
MHVLGRTNRGNEADKTICFSDRIKQYIDFVFDKISKWDDITGLDESKKTADEIYHNVRGDVFINGKDPRGVAAAIVLIGCQQGCLRTSYKYWNSEDKTPRAIVQADIAGVLGISEVAVRTNKVKLQKSGLLDN